MYDTVALSISSPRLPDRHTLGKSKCREIRDGSGNVRRIYINASKGSKEPRITIIFRPNGYHVHRAEVSIGEWLFGSNLHLPSADDLRIFFNALSAYWGDKTGLLLDTRCARVARLDITKDLVVDPSQVSKIIDEYRHFRFPKRISILINGTTLIFDSKGRKKSRRTLLYSKFDQIKASAGGHHELEMSLGVLRLEDRFLTNQAVTYLSKALGYSDHNASTMLTEHTYAKVMSKLVEKLGISKRVFRTSSDIRNLYEDLGRTRAGHIIEHMTLERLVDPHYYHDPVYRITKRAAQRLSNQATKAGLIRLE